MSDPLLLWEELLNHKYFRRLLPLIEEHPYRDDLTSLHSSLIVKGGRILSYGINKPFPNSFALNYAQHGGWQTHSECDSLYKAKKINLSGATIYNCRVTKNGDIEISKPCPGCTQMLEEYGIRKVVYSTSSGIEVVKINEYIMEIAA